MRTVLAPIGSRGDVQPMLALALGLEARGHTVTLAAPGNFAEWVRSHGITFAPVGGDIEADLKRHGDRLHDTAHQIRVLCREVIPLQFDLMPDICAGADLIVGAGLQVAGRAVAEKLGIPYAFVAYAPVVLRSAHYPPPMFRRQTLPRAVNRMAWWAFEQILGRVMAGPVNRGRRRLGLPPVRNVAAYMTPPRFIVAADRALTGPLPDLDARVHRVPAIRLPQLGALPPEVETFLAAGEPPVLVGFGSMVTNRGPELSELFAEAAARAGVRLLIQSGWTGLAHAGMPSHCLAVGPLPHDSLLPRVRAAVHHGGSGTTASVARASRPQLVMPYLLDQFYWAHRVRTLGLGPEPVPIGRVRSVGRLAAWLDDLSANHRYAERAGAVAREITGDGVGEAIRVLGLPRDSPGNFMFRVTTTS